MGVNLWGSCRWNDGTPGMFVVVTVVCSMCRIDVASVQIASKQEAPVKPLEGLRL